MPSTINGLPIHPLLVHATVVLVPLAVVATLLLALSSRARDAFGKYVVGLDVIALVSIPLATSTGEGLEARLPESELIERHADLAELMLPLAAVMTAAALAVWALREVQLRRTRWSAAAPAGLAQRAPALMRVAAVVAALSAVATGVQLVRVGDAGAKATWHGRLVSRPASGDDDAAGR